MTNIEVLARFGDPLERAVVRDAHDELVTALLPYADIWKNYVATGRIGSGEILKPEWMLFGGNHYTALIRLHNALGFYQEICALSLHAGESDDGALLLKLQSATTAFWWSLGTVVDNLGHSLKYFPGSTFINGTDDLVKIRPGCKYFYNRRTQLIHSRVVPIGIDTGYAVFDDGYLDGKHREALPASTEWKAEFENWKDLGEFYGAIWNEAKAELAGAWHFLSEKTRETANRTKLIFAAVSFDARSSSFVMMTAASACPPLMFAVGRSGTDKPKWL
jgi:hypothetical protein